MKEGEAKPGDVGTQRALRPRLVLLLIVVLGGGITVGRWLRQRLLLAERAAVETPVSAAHTDPQREVVSPVARGEILFQLHCAKCHGPDGHGEPEAVERLRPPPRDFATRPWRFSVDAATIRRVTQEGIPGTAMPAFRDALSQSEVESVVHHTLRLAVLPPFAEQEFPSLKTALIRAHFVPETKLRQAPGLRLTDAHGNPSTLAAQRGRWVLLNFWGVSCQHCLSGMPLLQSLAERWAPRGLVVLNICADSEDAAEAQQAAQRVSPRTRVWVDSSGLANSLFDVQAMPTIWLIGPDGKMIASCRGAPDWLSPAMDSLLGEALPN